LTGGQEFLQCELFVLGSFITLTIVIEYIHSDARPFVFSTGNGSVIKGLSASGRYSLGSTATLMPT
ncbi:MAG: hypothetical protein E7B29_17775, partial [Mixta calida]|nr:hypothetical protein [Mixta calida]